MDNPRKSPHVKSVGIDAALHYITICTKNHAYFFGSIRKGKMILSEIGEKVYLELAKADNRQGKIRIPLFVVMPNHFHALIACPPGMDCYAPELSKFIASLKSAATKACRKINPSFRWQPKYVDHLINSDLYLDYILDNIFGEPSDWKKDCFNKNIQNDTP